MMQVYLHRSPSGKAYVGIASRSWRNRWRSHVFDARHGSRLAFHAAIRKHGPEAFTHEVLAECETRAEAEALEMRLIAQFGTRRPAGYNLTAGGEGVTSPDAETRARMSLGSRGKKRSAETRRRLSAARLGVKRGPPSPEHCARIAAAHRGKKVAAETRRKLRDVNLGKRHSAETRAKMSAAQRDRARAPGVGAKISAAKRQYPRFRIAGAWAPAGKGWGRIRSWPGVSP